MAENINIEKTLDIRLNNCDISDVRELEPNHRISEKSKMEEDHTFKTEEFPSSSVMRNDKNHSDRNNSTDKENCLDELRDDNIELDPKLEDNATISKTDSEQDLATVTNVKEEDTNINSVINVKRNGTIKGGKPMLLPNNKRAALPKTRGRPPKSKSLVAMYHSQISDNKHGIKLRIKKSNTQPKRTRKRTKKTKLYHSDSENSDIESGKGKKIKPNQSNNNMEIDLEPREQSGWGTANLPKHILLQIFQNICAEEGCLPVLVRLSKVCSYWNEVATSNSLWNNLDLSTWTKEKFKTELKLKWLISNRLSKCQELNLSNWKVQNTACVLDMLFEYCKDIRGLNLTGWESLGQDHLKMLGDNLSQLERLDLSSINSSGNVTKSAVSTPSLCGLLTTMGPRLTQLLLANNKISGIPQIITAIASNCPNLRLLDLSNITTISNISMLHVEKLQEGCQDLRVLRITNSQIVLSNATLQEQAESPGFPMLEEFSIASVGDSARFMDDDAMGRFLKTSTRLKLLDVRGCARVTSASLVRVPAWDLGHLFLSGCYVTRVVGSGLELIAQKWSHSLVELDLAWSNIQDSLDSAVIALAEKGSESKLRVLNLCGSSVSLDPVKEVLNKCKNLNSLNLQSCRGLPRGIKRLFKDEELNELRNTLSKSPEEEEEK